MTYKREFKDWLEAFLEYSSYGEAPAHMRFWTGVSTIAGALRRKVWIDQAYFKWYPNFYVVIVAPPGIVSKSTTVNVGMRLLRKVPGIKFGPDIVTWPALVSAFADSAETFLYDGMHHTMSPITLEASEFGNLLNPLDREMVDLYVSLWDGKQGGFEKKTKSSGNDVVQNPWINLIACTTPAWIAGSFPEYMIGGGFTSRCVFVYAEKKAQYIAYPGLHVPKNLGAVEAALIRDLEHISVNIIGEYKLTADAIKYGESWYEDHYKRKPIGLDDERFGGYIARKQTHIHKLAMILAAAQGDALLITADHLAISNTMVSDLEVDMAQVFSKIGRSEGSLYMDRLISYVRKRIKVPYMEAYRYVYTSVPSMRDFEDMLSGCIRAGYLTIQQHGNQIYLCAVFDAKKEELPITPEAPITLDTPITQASV